MARRILGKGFEVFETTSSNENFDGVTESKLSVEFIRIIKFSCVHEILN